MIHYIIIGAGTAGCVLANRLSKNPECNVLLLEAGGADQNPDVRIPGRWTHLLSSDLDWSYKSAPQPHLNNRQIDLNRGKVLGGSSAINGMVHIRGHRWDYDRWAELGDTPLPTYGPGEWGPAEAAALIERGIRFVPICNRCSIAPICALRPLLR